MVKLLGIAEVRPSVLLISYVYSYRVEVGIRDAEMADECCCVCDADKEFLKNDSATKSSSRS